MIKYEIPEYYTDDSLTEEEKLQKDWEMNMIFWGDISPFKITGAL